MKMEKNTFYRLLLVKKESKGTLISIAIPSFVTRSGLAPKKGCFSCIINPISKNGARWGFCAAYISAASSSYLFPCIIALLFDKSSFLSNISASLDFFLSRFVLLDFQLCADVILLFIFAFAPLSWVALVPFFPFSLWISPRIGSVFLCLLFTSQYCQGVTWPMDPRSWTCLSEGSNCLSCHAPPTS